MFVCVCAVPLIRYDFFFSLVIVCGVLVFGQVLRPLIAQNIVDAVLFSFRLELTVVVVHNYSSRSFSCREVNA